MALGAVTSPADADDPLPIWDARLITPGLVFTQGPGWGSAPRSSGP